MIVYEQDKITIFIRSNSFISYPVKPCDSEDLSYLDRILNKIIRDIKRYIVLFLLCHLCKQLIS